MALFFSVMPAHAMAFLQESSFSCTSVRNGSMSHPHEMISSIDSDDGTPGQTLFFQSNEIFIEIWFFCNIKYP